MDTLTAPQIARLLGVSADTVRRLIDSGALVAYRLTDEGARRVERSELERYAKSRNIRLDWSVLES